MKWHVSSLSTVVLQTDKSGGVNTCFASWFELRISSKEKRKPHSCCFTPIFYNSVPFLKDKGNWWGGRRCLSVNLVGSWLHFCKRFETFSVVLLIARQVFRGKVCKSFMTFTASYDSHWHTLYANENRIMLHIGWCLTTLCNKQSLSFHHSTVGMEGNMER